MKLEMICGPCQGTTFYRHHVEPRVKLYVPRERTLPIPLKYIDVTRAASASLDVMLEKNVDDYWNVDGDRELSDTWDKVSPNSLFPERKTTGWICMDREETDKKTNDLQAIHFLAIDLERYVRCVEAKRKAEVGYRETKAR